LSRFTGRLFRRLDELRAGLPLRRRFFPHFSEFAALGDDGIRLANDLRRIHEVVARGINRLLGELQVADLDVQLCEIVT
jgi:hypothetical protein